MERHFTVSGFVSHSGKTALHFHGIANLWLPPGGHVEPDEDPIQAVQREVLEETDIPVEVVRTGLAYSWAAPGQVGPEFVEAMHALPLGGISAPVSTRFGFHLIKVEERRSVAPDTKQLRDQARQALRERKFDDAYAAWVREVRGRAYVEFREPPQ